MTSSSVRSPILLLHEDDSVAICIRDVHAGERFSAGGQSVVAAESIPAGHKMALCEHSIGQSVIKFGCPIGHAVRVIRPGEHVHSHNLAGDRSSPTGRTEKRAGVISFNRRFDAETHNGAALLTHGGSASEFAFDGYIRPNGRVGTRNYLAIISSVNCSASVARMIARKFESNALEEFANIDGVISFRHEGGCGMAWQGSRHRMLSRVLAAMSRHPNVGGCLMVGLGCEQGSVDHLIQSEGIHQIHLPANIQTPIPINVTPHVRPIPVLSIQTSGGTRRTIEKGVDMVRELLPEVNSATRTRVSAAHLVLGTECGGSDGYSGITANPVLGAAADLLVGCGGTVILSETPEIDGAEHLLAARARNADVRDKLIERLEWWRKYCGLYGEELDNNPSVGNKVGGLTTIAEKSLGAVAKGGTSPLEAVVDYAQEINSKGLVFMDTPGFDPASVTGMAAGGATMIGFTTGRGSCFGFKPAPSFKIASNSELFSRMPDDMDFDAGPILAGRSLEEMGRELLLALLECASGSKTCSERLGVGDEEFVPWLVGPVL